MQKLTQPLILTIFGASGDLAKLKLFPAIYELALNNLLPSDFAFFGFARSELSNEEYRSIFEESIRNKFKQFDNEVLNKVLEKTFYHKGNYDDHNSYQSLKEKIEPFLKSDSINLNYLSTPPVVFQDIIKNLAGVRSGKQDMRLIIEKPFGGDVKSANELFHFVSKYFDEDCFYLLDHYLGKPTVQSLLNLRRSNKIVNMILDPKEIANIQITSFEKAGVEERIGYFDKVGIINDMVQSHLLQILALTTMDIPVSEKGNDIQREKYNILSSLDYESGQNGICLGQYKSYCNDYDQCSNSKTETFAALRININRQDFYNVPIYIRTGKQMDRDIKYITIELKKYEFQNQELEPNRLIIEFYPDSEINITLVNSIKDQLPENVETKDKITCKNCLSEHSTLILDALNGDKKFFLSFKEILASWEIIGKIKEVIYNQKLKLEVYERNSSGPACANKIPQTDNFNWYEIS